MKQFTVITMLLVLSATSVGCRRGIGMWGLRGARCAPWTAPASAITPPPCVPQACPPSTVYDAGAAVDSGEVYLSPPAVYETVPQNTIYSEAIDDRVLPPAGTQLPAPPPVEN